MAPDRGAGASGKGEGVSELIGRREKIFLTADRRVGRSVAIPKRIQRLDSRHFLAVPPPEEKAADAGDSAVLERPVQSLG